MGTSNNELLNLLPTSSNYTNYYTTSGKLSRVVYGEECKCVSVDEQCNKKLDLNNKKTSDQLKYMFNYNEYVYSIKSEPHNILSGDDMIFNTKNKAYVIKKSSISMIKINDRITSLHQQ